MKKQLKKLYILSSLISLLCILPSMLFAHSGDTLKCNFELGISTLYVSGNGGYTCGTNGFGDLEIAQKYGVDTTITSCAAEDSSTMSEVLVWFGAKLVGPNDSVKVKVYSVHPTTGAPDLLLSTSFPMAVSTIDTSSANDTILTEFLLQAPVIITDSFFVSVVFSSSSGDTTGIMSTTDGNAMGTQLAWTKDFAGNWSSLQMTRGLDVDIAIFPIVVDEHVSSITENIFDQKSIKVYPNPASEHAVIEFILHKSVEELTFVLTDINGKNILEYAKLNLNPGNNNINVNTTSFSDGVYLFTITIGGKNYAGKLLIIRGN